MSSGSYGGQNSETCSSTALTFGTGSQPWREQRAQSVFTVIFLTGLYLVIGCHWQFAWQFGLIANSVVTCHKQFIIKYCLSATLGNYHECYKTCYNIPWSVNNSVVPAFVFCFLESAGGSPLAAKCGYLWPTEDTLCFLYAEAKNEGWLMLRVGCVTKYCFKGIDTPKRASWRGSLALSHPLGI